MNNTLALEKAYNPSRRLAKYWAAGKINYFLNTTYFADMVSMGLMVVARVWLFTHLYSKVFTSYSNGQFGSLDYAQTIWMLNFGQSFIISNRTRVLIKDITEDVQSGNIAQNMVKPYSYVFFQVSRGLGTLAGNIFSTVLISSIACWWLVGPITFTVKGLLAGIVLFFFGSLVNILISLSLGLSAFWTEDTSAIQRIYQKAQLIFGGVIVPLTMFPEALRKMAEVLPFGLAFFAPSRLLVKYDTGLFLKLLGVELAWVVIFSLSCVFIYRRGVKNVSLNGG